MCPASKCCCIRVLQASLYLRGEGYDRDFIVFSASFNFIDVYTFVGRSLTCGIGSKTSLKSFRTSASRFARDSAVARISIWSRIAPATLKSYVICGRRDRFLNRSLQTSMSSANISFYQPLFQQVVHVNAVWVGGEERWLGDSISHNSQFYLYRFWQRGR